MPRGRSRTYTDAQIEFLRVQYRELRLPELTEAFNREFGLSKSQGTIRSLLRNYRITSGRRGGSRPGERRALTPEQEKRLEEIYRDHPMREAVEIFNAEQGTRFTRQQLVTYVHNHGINSGRDGRYVKGQARPPGSGMKPGQTNAGTFKPGHSKTEKKPMGHRRICSTSGHYLIKAPLTNPYTGVFGWYVAEHRYNWEQAHGPIEKGEKIIFYDGNRLNPELANLRKVTDAEMLYLNRNGWADCPDELRDAMLAAAKLSCKAFDLEPSYYRQYMKRRKANDT